MNVVLRRSTPELVLRSGGGSRLVIGSVVVHSVSGSGSGDFEGPASSTDNALVRFDGTTGKLGQTSLVTVSDTGDVSLPALSTVDGRDVSVDGAKLDGITAGATNTPLSAVTPEPIGTAAIGDDTAAARADHVHAHGNQLGGALHALATASGHGFMPSGDKRKADHWLSVLDYGADPTGVAATFADAWDLAVAAIPIGSLNWGIYIPPGLYTAARVCLVPRQLQVTGGGNKSAAAGGTQIQGRKGFDVFRVQYQSSVISGGGGGSRMEGFVVSHESSTSVWAANTAGYLANESAVVPTTGYAGDPEVHTQFTLRCIKNGTSGGTQPTWASYGFGIPIAKASLTRASNVVTAVTVSAHGKSTGNEVYIISDDPNFASGFFTITVTNSTTFTYAQTGSNATSGMPTTLADVITDNTTAWAKVYNAGVKLEAIAHIKDVTVTGIGGDGFAVYASTGDSNNANAWKMDHCTTSHNLGWGYFTLGADANAGVMIGCGAQENGWGGFLECSFLGNYYFGCSAEGNGIDKYAAGVGYGFSIPSDQVNNVSVVMGTYLETGQIGLTHGRAFVIPGICPTGWYGSATILGNLRSSSLLFTNTAGDDPAAAAAAYIKVGRYSSGTEILSYDFSTTGSYIGTTRLSYGVVNGSGIDGWVALGNSISTSFAHSIDNAIDSYRNNQASGAGDIWFPNAVVRGTSAILNVRQTTKSVVPPTTGYFIGGDSCLELSQHVTGVIQAVAMDAGNAGSIRWGYVQAHTARAVAVDTTLAVKEFYIGITDTSAARAMTLPTGSSIAATLELLFKDESGACGIAGDITLVPGGSDTIDGVTAAYRIYEPYGWVRLMRRDNVWFVVDSSAQRRFGILAVTAATKTLAAQDSGRRYHNKTAVARVDFTLPPSAGMKIGDWFGFDNEEAVGMRVIGNTGQTIRLDGDVTSAASYFESLAVGSSLKLAYYGTNYWRAIEGYIGVWSKP